MQRVRCRDAGLNVILACDHCHRDMRADSFPSFQLRSLQPGMLKLPARGPLQPGMLSKILAICVEVLLVIVT